MCFTSRPTSDQRGSSLADGLRSKLYRISGTKQRKTKNLKLPASRLTKAHPDGKSPHPVPKVVGLTKKAAPSSTEFKGSPAMIESDRLGSPSESTVTHNADATTNSSAPNGVGSVLLFVSSGEIVLEDVRSERLVGKDSHTRNSEGLCPGQFVSNCEMSAEEVQSDRFASDSVSPTKLDKKAFISAQFISKMNTKQMKGVIKELKRAATTVGEKLPITQTKKKSKEEKERLELLEVEVQRPQVRKADEIKKAYGHAQALDQTNQAAMVARDKLHERGEKISAMHRRTTELEADAANFSSLAQELVKKKERKKWYEFS